MSPELPPSSETHKKRVAERPRRSERRLDPSADGEFDVAVIGGGFGGLGAALSLAENGARVFLCERLSYPGGCASTFSRGGAKFEAGATLFSGFGDDQLFGRWIARHRMDVQVDWLDPVIEVRSPSLSLNLERDPNALARALAAMDGAPQDALARFFRLQRKVADLVWDLLDHPEALPPLRWNGVLRHLKKTPAYLSLLPLVGKPLTAVLKREGLEHFTPLRLLLDALCQITIQCDAQSAEALFGLATADYPCRGTGHVRGGIGKLAFAMTDTIESLGATVSFANEARALARRDGGFRLITRRGEVRAKNIVANLLPQALNALLGDRPAPRLAASGEALEKTGWGACMLYVETPAAFTKPRHFQIIQDPSKPFIEGNHLFCSVSGPKDGPRTRDGYSTATVSTHVPLATLRALPEADQGPYVREIQDRLERGIQRFIPELSFDRCRVMTASPRTFERFTGRPFGLVGGTPRTAGWHNYRDVFSASFEKGLYLVGDSMFPGQSTLATALGGTKIAERIHH